MVLLVRDLLKRKKLVSMVGIVIKSIVPGEVTMNGPELVSTASDSVLNVVNVNSNFITECLAYTGHVLGLSLKTDQTRTCLPFMARWMISKVLNPGLRISSFSSCT